MVVIVIVKKIQKVRRKNLMNQGQHVETRWLIRDFTFRWKGVGQSHGFQRPYRKSGAASA